MKTSNEIGKLAAALSKAQGKFKAPPKDKTAVVRHKSGGGQHSYSYSDLATIIDCTKDILSANELAITQATCMEGSVFQLVARLMHSSGQWIQADYPLPGGGLPQEIGSAITYGRRYTLCALLGIAADEDEDGAAATKAKPEETTTPKGGKPRKMITSKEAKTAKCLVLGVDNTAGGEGKKAWQKYDVTLKSDNGQVIASTFSTTIGEAAMDLSGQSTYVNATVQASAKYQGKLDLVAMEVVQ